MRCMRNFLSKSVLILLLVLPISIRLGLKSLIFYILILAIYRHHQKYYVLCVVQCIITNVSLVFLQGQNNAQMHNKTNPQNISSNSVNSYWTIFFGILIISQKYIRVCREWISHKLIVTKINSFIFHFSFYST